jgi:phosphate transport system ATP-binding protein
MSAMQNQQSQLAPKMVVRELNTRYDNQPMLKNIKLEFADRQITAILGASGCGKSTLLRCLNRLNDPWPSFSLSGSVLLDGEDIYAKTADVIDLRRRVGMVFQKPNPFAKSIFENIAYGVRLHGLASKPLALAEAVEESLRAAALWDEVKDRLETPAQQLSGGQQQRLCIARALAIRPQVILLDEPCASLDPRATARIEELLAELAKSFCLILVTHSLAQAARVAHVTALLEAGEVIEVNQSSQFFTNPQHPKTQQYLSGG